MISFKRASGRFPFHFKKVYEKCIEYIRKSLHSDEADFKIVVKRGNFRRNCMAHSRELHEDEGSITFMTVIITT